MKQNAKSILYLLVASFILVIPLKTFDFREHEIEASTIQPKTLEEIKNKRMNFFSNDKKRGSEKLLNILIVPGHDDLNPGAKFLSLKEVELNRMLAQKLYDYLLEEEGINPVLVSDSKGYNLIFERYFRGEEKEIIKFIEQTKKNFSEKINEEEWGKVENNFHNVAKPEVVQRLYGINSWVNDQKFDLVIHIHFNDHADRKRNRIGKYDGFSIYTPGKFFGNYELSKKLADSIFDELKKIRVISNHEEEKNGIIEDHELIALGANESLGAGSILIEYGYIYEPLFTKKETRETIIDYLAYSTYKGIKNLLDEKPKDKNYIDTKISKNRTTNQNLIWQIQKAQEGKYPPEGKSLRDCPISGYFGECSKNVK